MSSRLFKSLDTGQQKLYIQERLQKIRSILAKELHDMAKDTGHSPSVSVYWDSTLYENGERSPYPEVVLEVEHTSKKTETLTSGDL